MCERVDGRCPLIVEAMLCMSYIAGGLPTNCPVLMFVSGLDCRYTYQITTNIKYVTLIV